MGRTVHNNWMFCIRSAHSSVSIAVSARLNYWGSVFFSRNSFYGHLQGTRCDCADVTVIQVRVSNTDWCIRSQAMNLTLKLVPADLSAVTVAAALTDTRHRRQIVQNIILTVPLVVDWWLLEETVRPRMMMKMIITIIIA